MGDTSHARLVARAKQGDHEALTAIYEHYGPLLYRFILYRVGDVQLAEDVHADIFVRMLEDLPRYEDRGWKISAWLYQIARDRIVDIWRARRRHPAVSLSDAYAADGSMEHDAEVRLLCADIWRSLGMLTPEQRDVIHMRFHLGMPIVDVAREMARTPAAIKSLQYRGVRTLSELLGDEPYEHAHVAEAP